MQTLAYTPGGDNPTLGEIYRRSRGGVRYLIFQSFKALPMGGIQPGNQTGPGNGNVENQAWFKGHDNGVNTLLQRYVR